MKILQAGAVPFRERDGQRQYLLVTSQRGNWIFPKGIVERRSRDPRRDPAGDPYNRSNGLNLMALTGLKLMRIHDWKRCRRARADDPQFDRRMYVRELILSSPRRSACWLLDEPSTGWGTAAGYYRWRRTTRKPSIDALSKRHLSPRAMIPSISRELLVA